MNGSFYNVGESYGTINRVTGDVNNAGLFNGESTVVGGSFTNKGSLTLTGGAGGRLIRLA